jgi:hypothetical protein
LPHKTFFAHRSSDAVQYSPVESALAQNDVPQVHAPSFGKLPLLIAQVDVAVLEHVLEMELQ